MEAKLINKENELYIQLKESKETKKVESVVPWNNNIQLIDVSLEVRGPKEDKVLGRNLFLRKSVRRGLSFITEKYQSPSILRKGLEKSFELRYEYIEIGREAMAQAWLEQRKDEKNLRDVIFSDITKAFSVGSSIQMYKTLKANGENAQVTYNKKFGAWVFASKNVSILVRNPEDLVLYEKIKETPRYLFAILIGKIWFQKLEKMQSLGVSIEELKRDMDGYTFIGEHVGNPLYQHLIEYKQIDVIFYAVVDIRGKHASQSCIPVPEAEAIFKKYGLSMVRIELRGTYNNESELYNQLSKINEEVSSSTLVADEEGSVLYFQEKTASG